MKILFKNIHNLLVTVNKIFVLNNFKRQNSSILFSRKMFTLHPRKRRKRFANLFIQLNQLKTHRSVFSLKCVHLPCVCFDVERGLDECSFASWCETWSFGASQSINELFFSVDNGVGRKQRIWNQIFELWIEEIPFNDAGSLEN